MNEIVENLVAGSSPGRASDVVIEGAPVGSDALHHIPNVIELADDVAAVVSRAALLADGNTCVVSVANVVVRVQNAIAISLGHSLTTRENAAIALNHIILNGDRLHDAGSHVIALRRMADMNTAGAQVVKGRILNHDIGRGRP